MSTVPGQAADSTSKGSCSWTSSKANSQTNSRNKSRNRRVHFSHSTTVRMIENPDSFSTKFRNFKRSFVKTLPCLNIEVSPFLEYTKETEFEEKQGDLAKVGMPPRKRGSIGEIDLGELKAQLDKMHKMSMKLIKVAEAEEKMEADEIRNVEHISSPSVHQEA